MFKKLQQLFQRQNSTDDIERHQRLLQELNKSDDPALHDVKRAIEQAERERYGAEEAAKQVQRSMQPPAHMVSFLTEEARAGFSSPRGKSRDLAKTVPLKPWW